MSRWAFSASATLVGDGRVASKPTRSGSRIVALSWTRSGLWLAATTAAWNSSSASTMVSCAVAGSASRRASERSMDSSSPGVARIAAKPAAVGSIASRTSERSRRKRTSGAIDREPDLREVAQEADVGRDLGLPGQDVGVEQPPRRPRPGARPRPRAHLDHSLVRQHLHRLAEDGPADAQFVAEVGFVGEGDLLALPLGADHLEGQAARYGLVETDPDGGRIEPRTHAVIIS